MNLRATVPGGHFRLLVLADQQPKKAVAMSTEKGCGLIIMRR